MKSFINGPIINSHQKRTESEEFRVALNVSRVKIDIRVKRMFENCLEVKFSYTWKAPFKSNLRRHPLKGKGKDVLVIKVAETKAKGAI